MLVRLATHADTAAILALAEEFISASAYGMEFDKDRSVEYVELLLDHPEIAFFVSDDVKAGVVVSVAHDWCKQPVCYVEKLFLSPSVRGTGVARSLVVAAVEFGRQHDCSHIFSTATAGLGETVEKLYTNLFRKFGFSACGPVLCRSF